MKKECSSEVHGAGIHYLEMSETAAKGMWCSDLTSVVVCFKKTLLVQTVIRYGEILYILQDFEKKNVFDLVDS